MRLGRSRRRSQYGSGVGIFLFLLPGVGVYTTLMLYPSLLSLYYSVLDWEGGPRLDGCAAAVGCAIHAIHDGGDHWIVVGRVLALHRTSCTTPLLFHGSRYACLGTTFESEILVSGF